VAMAASSVPPNKALQLTPRAHVQLTLVPFWRRGSGGPALAVSARGAAEHPSVRPRGWRFRVNWEAAGAIGELVSGAAR
jgi:hypothetical protein